MSKRSPQVVKRPWNTKEKGLIEFLVYREDTRYVAVCLTFNIVVEDKNREVAKKGIEDAAKLHLRVVQKKRLPDELLNRHAPKEYWDRYDAFCRYVYAKEVESHIKKSKGVVSTSQEPYRLNAKSAAPASA